MRAVPNTVKENANIVLFDGTCHLCSQTLAFVARHDTRSRYRFAWVQSEEGKEILRWCGLRDDHYDTMVTVESGKVYLKSTAFLRVTRHLGFPLSLLSLGIIVPRFLRDGIYDWLAVRRNRLLGKEEECMLPQESIRDRFLRNHY